MRRRSKIQSRVKLTLIEQAGKVLSLHWAIRILDHKAMADYAEATLDTYHNFDDMNAEFVLNRFRKFRSLAPLPATTVPTHTALETQRWSVGTSVNASKCDSIAVSSLCSPCDVGIVPLTKAHLPVSPSGSSSLSEGGSSSSQGAPVPKKVVSFSPFSSEISFELGSPEAPSSEKQIPTIQQNQKLDKFNFFSSNVSVWGPLVQSEVFF